MIAVNKIINTICKNYFHRDYILFNKELIIFKKVQEEILLNIIKKNRYTLFGKIHNFNKMNSIREYQNNVPITDYDFYKLYINKIINGEKKILTLDRVILLELTSGTSNKCKFIPYTLSLKNEFNRAINTWIYDLYYHFKDLILGKSYWSITPVQYQIDEMNSQIPIGFEDDADYLGFIGKILQNVFVVPKAINQVKKSENFKYITSYFLLKESELALISIWNPTYLLLIINYISIHFEKLIKDIYDGKLKPPYDENIKYLLKFCKKQKKRALQLERFFSNFTNINFTQVWHKLKVISCWCDGASKYSADLLKQYFPNIYIQPKGLIATEGIISFPLINAKGSVCAYHSHFLEFLPEGSHLKTKLLHELERDQIYTVIMTTSGGLYRYCLGDRIKVVDHYKGVPVVIFLSRENTSDIVGEKLNEYHVQQILNHVIKKYHIKSDFFMLAPQLEKIHGYYTLFIETKNNSKILNNVSSIVNDIENRLCENFYYKQAIQVGQLKPVKIFLIKDQGLKTYFNRLNQDGQKLGDIKPVVLSHKQNWHQYFTGIYL